MLIDDAVSAHVYKRGELFYLPRSLYQQAASQYNGIPVLKDDWSQVLFLCSDAIAISFWLQRPNEGPLHTLVSLDLDDVARAIPELVDLWLWKHVDETWAEVLAHFAGRFSVSEYVRNLARSYPQCFSPQDAGIN